MDTLRCQFITKNGQCKRSACSHKRYLCTQHYNRSFISQKGGNINIPLVHIKLPISLVASIVENKPEGVNAEFYQSPKPLLVVNGKNYHVISPSDKRNMRSKIYYIDYYQRDLTNEQFVNFLQQNPIVVRSIPFGKHTIYEIIDGMHRIERAIWMGLITIPAIIQPQN